MLYGKIEKNYIRENIFFLTIEKQKQVREIRIESFVGL